MPALLLPTALAALLAVLMPLAIHLARRSEALPLDFAALRWLREKPRPKSRLRFDEWPLLIARLLLLAILVAWLARPVLPDSADMTPVVAALPGVDAGEPAPGSRNLWLAPGFPPFDVPQDTCLSSGPGQERSGTPATLCANPLSLIRQLDAGLAPGVPLTLVVPQILDGIDAERPRLSRAVTWRIVPGEMPAATGAAAPMPGFSLRGPESAVRPIRAALAALTAPGSAAVFAAEDATAPLPVPPRILVWLLPGPMPAAVRDWIAGGGTALVGSTAPAEPGTAIIVWRDAVGAPLVEAYSLGAGRVFRFTRPLTPAAMPDLVEPGFPKALAALFAPPTAPPARVFARDIAPVTGAPAWPQPARDLQPWLAILVALLVIAERWLATRRDRATAP